MACYKCKEFVPVLLGDFLSQKYEKLFREEHKYHPVFTTQREFLGEFKDTFTENTELFNKKAPLVDPAYF